MQCKPRFLDSSEAAVRFGAMPHGKEVLIHEVHTSRSISKITIKVSRVLTPRVRD